jgi:hypothetical protein
VTFPKRHWKRLCVLVCVDPAWARWQDDESGTSDWGEGLVNLDWYNRCKSFKGSVCLCGYVPNACTANADPRTFSFSRYFRAGGTDVDSQMTGLAHRLGRPGSVIAQSLSDVLRFCGIFKLVTMSYLATSGCLFVRVEAGAVVSWTGFDAWIHARNGLIWL